MRARRDGADTSAADAGDADHVKRSVRSGPADSPADIRSPPPKVMSSQFATIRIDGAVGLLE